VTRKTAPARRLVLAKGLRFDCKRCADCCHLAVPLTAAEVERYGARDWSALIGRPLGPVHEPGVHEGQPGTFLTRRADGACVFLGPDRLCEVHRHLGEAEKPLTCRAFPFTFVGGGEGGRPTLGASFACSSIASGDGEAVAARRRGLDELLEEVEAQGALR
jgi:lysine-N-methylase